MEDTRRQRARVVKGHLMRVSEIMSTNVVTVDPKETASVTWSRMRRRSIRHLVVAENGRLRGVISERDLGGGGDASIRKGRVVEDLMTPRVVNVCSVPYTRDRRLWGSATSMKAAPSIRRACCFATAARGRMASIPLHVS